MTTVVAPAVRTPTRVAAADAPAAGWSYLDAVDRAGIRDVLLQAARG